MSRRHEGTVGSNTLFSLPIFCITGSRFIARLKYRGRLADRVKEIAHCCTCTAGGGEQPPATEVVNDFLVLL